MACAVLHNIAIDWKTRLEESDDVHNAGDDGNDEVINAGCGTQVRNAVVETWF